MNSDKTMFTFVKNNSNIKHLALPFLYSVEKESIKQDETFSISYLHDDNCIKDELFDYFFSLNKENTSQQNTSKRNTKKNKITKKRNTKKNSSNY
jgi:hypothetical protein